MRLSLLSLLQAARRVLSLLSLCWYCRVLAEAQSLRCLLIASLIYLVKDEVLIIRLLLMHFFWVENLLCSSS